MKKAKDLSGKVKPLVLYRGTGGGVSDPLADEGGCGVGSLGSGSYWTTSEQDAEKYAKEAAQERGEDTGKLWKLSLPHEEIPKPHHEHHKADRDGCMLPEGLTDDAIQTYATISNPHMNGRQYRFSPEALEHVDWEDYIELIDEDIRAE
eukprot:TRINITY_DN64902_c0_g1_i1.p1 TRINITY_DN64902_c0_g1~~TRINITY_DN64902_c0_g1_i1.p1  ORF type:complete len:149 (-),score=27.08 TRINITY_DN64902_c0_g1_i1:222-668(-)